MLVGHKKQWEYLKNSFENGRLAHAFLFCGENKIGKKTFAIEFIKLLNCQNEIGPVVRTTGLADSSKNENNKNELNKKPCEVCKNCLDIAKGNFPDFLFVRAGEESVGQNNFDGMFSYNFALPDLKTGEELKDKKEIEISQSRKTLDFLSLKAYFGNYKAVIIDNAEKLTIQAQNCLLKTLEEPKGKTILILISSQPERLLATISSRCQTIKFFSVPAKEIQQFLSDTGCPAKKAEELADLADGKPGRAIEAFLNPEKLEREQEILKDLLNVISQNLAEKFAYTKNLKEDGEDIINILEILQKYFRHLLLQKVGVDPDSGKYNLEKLQSSINLISKTINDISFTNASPKLALEILLMEM